MLDESTLTQLHELFAQLQADYTLVVSPSAHERQADLTALADAVASTTPRITQRSAGEPSPKPHLTLHRNGQPTGVSFRGVPGGHEFTSLVLAILHADGRGKLPDPALQSRVRNLKGGHTLRTYVSLSCNTCPEVVQALNLMAILHPRLEHQMIDGELCQDEVERLGLQGVPAVAVGDEVIHVGKASFAQLLALLEAKLGRDEHAAGASTEASHYDVVVIGGGPAGTSAAIYSARKGLTTAIVAERFGGQVQDTLGIENLIGTPYTEGPKLVAELEAHVRTYPIEVLEHRHVERIEGGTPATLHIQGGERIMAGAVIVATGAAWRQLGVPGEREHIGRGVAYCPHCDGPFYKGLPVAVVGGGNSGVEAALDLANLCSEVTLVEFADALKADAVLVDKLRQRHNVQIITSARTTEVVAEEGKVVGMRYEDRRSGESKLLPVQGIFVQIGLAPNSGFVGDLLERNRVGEIVVDARGRTSVPGIYAAGDVTTVPSKQIVVAMGEGAKAALTAFEDGMRAAA